MVMKLLKTALLGAMGLCALAHGSKHRKHQVTDLPNFEADINFKHYAGRLQLETSEKYVVFWYAESQNDPENDPIVLWLNGGPGCSSMGGFFTENGPFVVQHDLSVKVNRYSWNRKANLVWLESPAGVGFSGPLQNASYYNDDNVAAKTYEFLQLFFDKYSELKHRDFYITGESYAGIYIPFLVDLLVDNPIPGVKLSGFAIGNPFTDNDIDGNAYMDYYYSHGLISLENYRDMVKYCGSEIGVCMYSDVNCTKSCQDALNEGVLAADADQFNPYYIYGDKCLLSNTQGGSLRYTRRIMPSPTHRGDVGPCTDTFTQYYLRLPEVQEAIHVNGDYVNWTDCNDDISSVYTRADSSLPKYPNILSHGLKALIYSGDADSVVNFIGTERWIGEDGLKLHVTKKWKSWRGPDQQIAGYVQEYEGLTFLTVKGAGHMVPAVRPLHGLSMFECFIYGEEACKDFEYPLDDEQLAAGLGYELQLAIRAEKVAAFVPVFAMCVGLMALMLLAYRNSQRRAMYQRIGSTV